MGDTTFDDTLFAILKECKVLPRFLDVIFGFLKRRTDFYVVTDDPNSPVGLPQGLAEGIVKDAFFKWKMDGGDICRDVPEAIHETEVTTTENISKGVKSLSIEGFTSSESYNGAVYRNYSWTQTITEVGIIVKVPENISTRDLVISILPSKISVKLKNSDSPLLEGELCKKCKHQDAIWSLDKKKLDIHLEKVMEMWWDCLIQSEPKLDLAKIDCSRPFEELSQEAQAKIEELTWNQERKRMGLPTSEELVMQEKLKKAWNVEGSPFTGPYDPNAVIFN